MFACGVIVVVLCSVYLWWCLCDICAMAGDEESFNLAVELVEALAMAANTPTSAAVLSDSVLSQPGVRCPVLE